MARILLLIVSAAAAGLATLLYLEIQRSDEREKILFDQIGMLEETLKVPISQRFGTLWNG